MRLLFALLLALASLAAAAQTAPPPGSVLRIATRPEVSVPLYVVERPDAVATVVLFSGGGGGYGQIGANGWPQSGNFLIRTGQLWAQHPFNVVMVGRPSDGLDLAHGPHRVGALHAADNAALLRALRQRSPLPLWLVGTSMGTLSAAAAAIADREGLVAGLVLTSSIVAYKIRGAVPTQNLDAIRVPTLIVHHAQDGCWACRPDEAEALPGRLVNAPLKKLLLLNGGEGARGDPCEAFHHHGYVGIEGAAVDRIAAWIRAPAD
jgi:pimeloyl-ACP methyl ester carboxylesterase